MIALPTEDMKSVAEMIAAWDKEDALSEISSELETVKLFKGRGQETRMVEDLDLVDFDAKDPWPIVGLDNRVYEQRLGLIECLAAAKLPKEDPEVYVQRIDWSKFPLEGELLYLYKTFFSQYDREVLMLIGCRRDGSGFRYHVPWQEGTAGLVTWKADLEEMGQFQEECSWVGTIHVHPGNNSTPSQTDIDDWATPEKSGLHLIFGKDGSYSIHGAIAGRTFEVGSGGPGFDHGTVAGLDQGVITTSRGRPYKDLLTKPKPIVVKSRKRLRNVKRTKVSTTPLVTQVKPTTDSSSSWHSIWDEHLDRVGSLDVAYEDAWDLSIVMTGNSIHILTSDQWEEFATLCEENACALPTRHNLTLKGGGL